MKYWTFDPDVLARKYTMVRPKRYPMRIPPKQWPDMELIGKAMARGWAVPCRYYPRVRGRGGFYITFIFPGISDVEHHCIHALMKQEE